MDEQALQRLKNEGQNFFIPYYRRIVARNPFGIRAVDVKQQARLEIQSEFGFDPFDDSLTGTYGSTGGSAVSQLANNLISNSALTDHMLVAKPRSRAVLYPLDVDNNSIPVENLPEGPTYFSAELVDAANTRMPHKLSQGFYRSAALAEHVRRSAGFECVIDDDGCVRFDGRDGNSYVEVHHVVPMALQGATAFNLDQVDNMVAVCAGCHRKLHCGHRDVAEAVLDRLLDRYAQLRPSAFVEALHGCDLPHGREDLLTHYGVGQ